MEGRRLVLVVVGGLRMAVATRDRSLPAASHHGCCEGRRPPRRRNMDMLLVGQSKCEPVLREAGSEFVRCLRQLIEDGIPGMGYRTWKCECAMSRTMLAARPACPLLRSAYVPRPMGGGPLTRVIAHARGSSVDSQSGESGPYRLALPACGIVLGDVSRYRFRPWSRVPFERTDRSVPRARD